MQRSQDLSIAHDLLVQDTQENHEHKKKYFIKIGIQDNSRGGTFTLLFEKVNK